MKPGPLIFFALFAAAVSGAWAWFNTAPPPDDPGIWLEVRTNLAGHTFTPEPLTKTAMDILATDDLVNGTFTPVAATEPGSDPATQVVRVFRANWSAKSGQGMTVVQHTPDVCWVGAGWKPIDLGQPKQVEIEIPVTPDSAAPNEFPKSVRLPFECRVFRSPDGQAQELVLWCTLVSGRVLPEQSRFDPGQPLGHELTERERQAAAGRRLSAGYFSEALKNRLPTRGNKQFVRLSARVDHAWRDPLLSLQAFTPRWLGDTVLPDSGPSRSP
ncbi:MAG: hypothetical protein AB9869_26835 [Verrucomicrobiia bacterium]